MKRFFCSAVCLGLPLFLSFQANAQQEPLKLKDGAPKTYIVEKGDTLWDISGLYLQSPWLWPRLWQVNPEIDNPHLIYPGDKLSLIWRDGHPVLSLKAVKKLSPKARITEKKAVPTVKEELVLPYLSSDRLISEEQLALATKVIGNTKGIQFLTSEDTLYISGQHSEEKWGIYRPVDTYERTDVSASITALKLIAEGKLDSANEDYTGLKISTQVQEIMHNDIALPIAEKDTMGFTTTFYPQPAPAGADASIVGNIEGMQFSVSNQVVVIDKGSQDKLRQGSILKVMEAAEPVYEGNEGFSKNVDSASTEIQLPATKIGELMVIRPYDFFSLALITSSKKPINTSVAVESPVASPNADEQQPTP